jgi:hypothetical protein
MSLSVNFPAMRPTLNLNFARARQLDPRITFTRASTATYFDSSGVLQTAIAGQPRFDFSPTTGESLGLLIEEQRTNLLTYSEQFENAAWAKIRTTISANVAVDPQGFMTADKLIENTDNNTHFTRQSPSLVGSTPHTVSVYLKAAERTEAIIRLFQSGGWATSSSITVNLLTGSVVVAGSGATGSATDVGNGWYRVAITQSTNATTGTKNVDIFPALNGTDTYTGDGTSGIFLWGAQLEVGAFPTSYIPTVAAAATRNADVATITGSNFSGFYNQNEGTLYGESTTQKPTTAGTVYAVAIDDGTTNNFISSLRFSGSDIRGRVDSGAVIQAQMLTIGVYTVNVFYKSAIGYKINDFAVSTNGTLGPLDNSGSIPTTVNRLSIGTLASLANTGHIRKISYYPFRLTDAQLQALTS